jgi:MarR family 2-MHQ and catechol resistance regulon transcriptional repressor
MTTVIDNLEKRELVVRKRSLQDRRLLHVHLTPKSQKLMEKLFPKHAARVVEEMSVLSAAEMAELGRLCRKLGLGNEKT